MILHSRWNPWHDAEDPPPLLQSHCSHTVSTWWFMPCNTLYTSISRCHRNNVKSDENRNQISLYQGQRWSFTTNYFQQCQKWLVCNPLSSLITKMWNVCHTWHNDKQNEILQWWCILKIYMASIKCSFSKKTTLKYCMSYFKWI